MISKIKELINYLFEKDYVVINIDSSVIYWSNNCNECTTEITDKDGNKYTILSSYKDTKCKDDRSLQCLKNVSFFMFGMSLQHKSYTLKIKKSDDAQGKFILHHDYLTDYQKNVAEWDGAY